MTYQLQEHTDTGKTTAVTDYDDLAAANEAAAKRAAALGFDLLDGGDDKGHIYANADITRIVGVYEIAS